MPDLTLFAFVVSAKPVFSFLCLAGVSAICETRSNAELFQPQSDVELRDSPVVGLYVNNPREVTPEELRTDIRIPVA